MKLNRNIGTVDRTLRIGVGVGVLLAGYYYQGLWGFLGLIPFLTGVVSICPLYSLIGLNTGAREPGPSHVGQKTY